MEECCYCKGEPDGAMLVMSSQMAHVYCVIRKLNELLDPDYEGKGEPDKIIGFLAGWIDPVTVVMPEEFGTPKAKELLHEWAIANGYFLEDAKLLSRLIDRGWISPEEAKNYVKLADDQSLPEIPSFDYDTEGDRKLLQRGTINYSKMFSRWRKVDVKND